MIFNVGTCKFFPFLHNISSAVGDAVGVPSFPHSLAAVLKVFQESQNLGLRKEGVVFVMVIIIISFGFGKRGSQRASMTYKNTFFIINNNNCHNNLHKGYYHNHQCIGDVVNFSIKFRVFCFRFNLQIFGVRFGEIKGNIILREF